MAKDASTNFGQSGNHISWRLFLSRSLNRSGKKMVRGKRQFNEAEYHSNFCDFRFEILKMHVSFECGLARNLRLFSNENLCEAVELNRILSRSCVNCGGKKHSMVLINGLKAYVERLS